MHSIPNMHAYMPYSSYISHLHTYMLILHDRVVISFNASLPHSPTGNLDPESCTENRVPGKKSYFQ